MLSIFIMYASAASAESGMKLLGDFTYTSGNVITPNQNPNETNINIHNVDVSDLDKFIVETNVVWNHHGESGTAWNFFWVNMADSLGASKNIYTGYYQSATKKTGWSGDTGGAAEIEEGKEYLYRVTVDRANSTVQPEIYDAESGKRVDSTKLMTSPTNLANYKTFKGVTFRKDGIMTLGLTVNYVKVYDPTFKVEKVTMSQDDETVRIDSDIKLEFSRSIDEDSVQNIEIKNAAGDAVQYESAIDGAAVTLTFPLGLEYDTEYTLTIPDTVTAADGANAVPYENGFKTEKSPMFFEVSASVKGDKAEVEADYRNLSPYKITKKIILAGFDSKNTLIWTDVCTFTIEAGKADEKAIASIEIPGDKEIDSIKCFDMGYTNEYSEEIQTDLTLTGARCNRAFSPERFVYDVLLYEDDAKIELSGAEKIADDESVAVFEKDEKKYIFRKRQADKNTVKEIIFEDKLNVSIKFDKKFNEDSAVLILKSKEKGGEESYSFDEFLSAPSTDILYRAVMSKKGSDTVKITFDENDESGMYKVAADDSADGICGGENKFYFTSDNDLKIACEDLEKAKSADDKYSAIHEYILENKNILKITLDDYESLKDKTLVADFLIAAEVNDWSDIKDAFNLGKAISNFNEAEKKAQAVKKYNDIFKADLDNFENVKNESDVDSLLKNEKCNKAEDVSGKFNTAVSLALINQSDRSEVLGVLEKNSAYLMIDDTTMEEYKKVQDKAKIITALVSKNFNSTDELISALKKGIKDAAKNDDPPKGNTGGNSGGGGGTKKSGVTSYVYTDKKDESKDETKDEGKDTTKPEETVSFSDVEDNHWAHAAITELLKREIISGKGEGIFAPDDEIKREEFTKMLMNALNIENRFDEEPIFDDVPLGRWYGKYIYSAYKMNLINGIGNGLFGLGKSITRQDMAVMVNNAALARGIELPKVREEKVFADEDNISDYAKDAVKRLYEAGIINGVEENRFAPEKTSTRAMAAQMLYKFLEIAEVSE